MSEWQTTPLRNLVSLVVDNRGKTPPISETGHELLEVNAVSQDRRAPDYSKVRKFVSEETYKNWFRKGHPKPGDILVPTVGTIGNVALVRENRGAIAQNLIALRFKKNIDSDFVYYYLSSTLGKDMMLSLDIGGVQPSIKVPHLLDMEIQTPCDNDEQKAIASVLSSLDDKIDLLHRQNKTLEAMAETLFRQWFVEEAQEDGKEGRLGEVIELHYGKGLKAEDRAGSGYPVVGSSGIVDYHTEFLVKGPGIVIGRKGTLGKVIYLWGSFYPIDTTYYVKSKVESAGLLYEYFLLKTIGFEDMNTDSAVPGLNRDIALSTEIKIPPEDKLHAFNTLVADFVRKLKTNRDQIRTLEKLRDTLLPKLMSGEVRVGYNMEVESD